MASTYEFKADTIQSIVDIFECPFSTNQVNKYHYKSFIAGEGDENSPVQISKVYNADFDNHREEKQDH